MSGPRVSMTVEELAQWAAEQTQKAYPLHYCGPGSNATAYVLIIGKHPSLVGDVGFNAVKLGRFQALQLAVQILNGFAAEARTAGSAEFKTLKAPDMARGVKS